jgi:hypothetical protein
VPLKTDDGKTDLELIQLLVCKHDKVLPFDVDCRVNCAPNSVRLTSNYIVKLICHGSKDTEKLFLPETLMLIP